VSCSSINQIEPVELKKSFSNTKATISTHQKLVQVSLNCDANIQPIAIMEPYPTIKNPVVQSSPGYDSFKQLPAPPTPSFLVGKEILGRGCRKDEIESQDSFQNNQSLIDILQMTDNKLPMVHLMGRESFDPLVAVGPTELSWPVLYSDANYTLQKSPSSEGIELPELKAKPETQLESQNSAEEIWINPKSRRQPQEIPDRDFTGLLRDYPTEMSRSVAEKVLSQQKKIENLDNLSNKNIALIKALEKNLNRLNKGPVKAVNKPESYPRIDAHPKSETNRDEVDLKSERNCYNVSEKSEGSMIARILRDRSSSNASFSDSGLKPQTINSHDPGLNPQTINDSKKISFRQSPMPFTSSPWKYSSGKLTTAFHVISERSESHEVSSTHIVKFKKWPRAHLTQPEIVGNSQEAIPELQRLSSSNPDVNSIVENIKLSKTGPRGVLKLCDIDGVEEDENDMSETDRLSSCISKAKLSMNSSPNPNPSKEAPDIGDGYSNNLSVYDIGPES
jgi:DNA-binding protein YbaB